ncbi:efflux RND transporter periplasmic adaptor subunit [Alsobacter sp. SYSU M60028]|uniref:Efflux RND transporter periplasmic adaptor subunit n=1 Tax=Alsobacter ponti TaxID=2962936 RepID=A0ABT1LFB6_9HYPH|nr:efflux RND transporter periplasmic adaptor subunit [Alsobacter ponti]MCP8939593.1 efflux RND transporter periplasmic adaptor subunit [Alsobacter ponti]
MTWSRLIAVLLVLAAGAWIASGHYGLGKAERARPASALTPSAEAKPFRVAVATADVVERARRLTLSGRTEADQRTMAVARANGFVTHIKVQRGSKVAEGDPIAVLSDEAREANVLQARARLEQRNAEFDARRKLIDAGNLPRLNLVQLEADLRSAEAALAQAIAERDRGTVLAPITGIVNELPAVIGQAMQPGAPVAEVIALDPMLAVVEISERRLSGVKVGDGAAVRLATGVNVEGAVRFISSKASAQTRTYRVEVRIPNQDGAIPDGVTAEVSLRLAPTPATRITRSALTFSAEGRLGVRVVGEGDVVAFVPVSLVEDEAEFLWVSGIKAGARIIVQGQDFVKEGQHVEPVPATGQAAS